MYDYTSVRLKALAINETLQQYTTSFNNASYISHSIIPSLSTHAPVYTPRPSSLPVCLFVFACFVCVLPCHNILPLVECCFTSTETVDVLGTGAQNGHLDLHTAPEVWTTPFSVFFSHSRSISVHTSRVIIKCDSTKNKFRFRIQPHERLAMDRPAKMHDSSV